MKKVRGSSLGIVIIIIVAVAVVVIVLYIMGKGNNKGAENVESIPVVGTIQTTKAITTKEIVYVDVTVSENKYIFNNITYEIEEIDSLVSNIKSTGEEFTVRITDEYASSKAYENLTLALKEQGILYINE